MTSFGIHYGVATRLSRGQALGRTGSAQTTYLDAAINGQFFGKFANRLEEHFPANKGISKKSGPQVNLIKMARWINYPDWATRPANWDSEKSGEGAPHAEDLLLVALETAYLKNTAVFTNKGTPRVGKSPLLSIRINNSPCARCAQNLMDACDRFGLSLRVKASFHFEKDETDDSGTHILHEAGVPVRHWRTAKITAKTSGVASKGKRRLSGTEKDWFTAARNDTDISETTWDDPYKRANLDNLGQIRTYLNPMVEMDVEI